MTTSDDRQLLLAGYFIPPQPGYSGGPRVASVWLGTPDELSEHYDRAVQHIERCGFSAMVIDVVVDWQDEANIKAKADELRQRTTEIWVLEHPEYVGEEQPPEEILDWTEE